MREEDKLKDKFGTGGGWKVPEGYFENFYKEMEAKLPPYVAAPKEPDLTIWQRLKPYVYLAAMFAGIWMMMKIFHTASTSSLSLDNPPAQIAMVMEDMSTIDSYGVSQTLSDYDVTEDVLANYSDIKDFENDFGYELAPRYERIDISEMVSGS